MQIQSTESGPEGRQEGGAHGKEMALMSRVRWPDSSSQHRLGRKDEGARNQRSGDHQERGPMEPRI